MKNGRVKVVFWSFKKSDFGPPLLEFVVNFNGRELFQFRPWLGPAVSHWRLVATPKRVEAEKSTGGV